MRPNDPTTVEQALRQMRANRNAARDQDHHAHVMPYRPHFVRHILQLRKWLRETQRCNFDATAK